MSPMLRGPIVTSSRLRAGPEEVWAHATSFEGVNAEFRGLLRMTAPREVRATGLAGGVVLGERLCRSWILLFGVLPFDYDDITLVEPAFRMSDEHATVREQAAASLRPDGVEPHALGDRTELGADPPFYRYAVRIRISGGADRQPRDRRGTERR